MQFLISAVLGYLSGSIPTAYLLLKRKKGIDITNAGSGNVGAMNSFEITGSKKIGFTVFIIDFLKGLLPVLLSFLLFDRVFIFGAITLVFAVLSHCFNPWISFKGGRGLATAAGGSIIIFPYLLVMWIISWIILYAIKRDILYANVFTNILMLLILFITYKFAYNYAYPEPASVGELLLFASTGLIIIFIKHIEPLKEIFLKKQKNQK